MIFAVSSVLFHTLGHRFSGKDVSDIIRRPAKVSSSILPAEHDLIRLIQGVKNPDPSWTPDTPACDWVGVSCNDAEKVRAIRWEWMQSLYGTLSLRYLPVSLVSFSVDRTFNLAHENKLSGEIELTSLPAGLTDFNLSENRFNGSVDLTSLPENLTHLYLNGNDLCGEVCLDYLPLKLQHLSLSKNHFTGTPILTKLPPALVSLGLSQNQFEGHINLDALPLSLKHLWLDENKELSGTYSLNMLPKCISLTCTSTGLSRWN